MRFEEAYYGWTEKRLTQGEATDTGEPIPHMQKVKVRVHRYPNGRLVVLHGPRKLADYDENGILFDSKTYAVA